MRQEESTVGRKDVMKRRLLLLVILILVILACSFGPIVATKMLENVKQESYYGFTVRDL